MTTSNRNVFVLSCLLFVCLLFAGFAESYGKDDYKSKRRYKFKELNLTDQQDEKLAKMNESFLDKKMDIQKKVFRAREDIVMELLKDKPDEKKVSDLKEMINDNHKKSIDLMVDHQRKVAKLLTKQQRESAMKDGIIPLFHPGMGMGMGMQQGHHKDRMNMMKDCPYNMDMSNCPHSKDCPDNKPMQQN